MEYMELITLIKNVPRQDEIGQIVFDEIRHQVYARKNVVGSREFYSAVAVGITPTAELQIRLCEYDNETEVEYNGTIFSIIRTIPKGKFDLVLVLGVKSGVK